MSGAVQQAMAEVQAAQARGDKRGQGRAAKALRAARHDQLKHELQRAGMIKLAKIRTDGGTQSRAAINEATVAEYAEAMADAGATFPPAIVYHDGKDYWLADGFHRVAAWARIGQDEVPCDVRQGDRRAAVLHSVGANGAHGLRRTGDDKRRAVMTLLEDAEWSKWSNREIARQCGVSEGLVRSLRTERSDEPRTYITKHGTEATMNTARIGAGAPAEPEPAAQPHPVAPILAGGDDGRQEAGADAPPPAEPEGEDYDPYHAEQLDAAPDPHAKLRREFRAMTPEAREDDWIALRAETADLRKRVKTQRGQIADLKAEVKVLTDGDDMGRKLGQLLRERDTLGGRIKEHQATIKRLEYRLRKIEGEEITL